MNRKKVIYSILKEIEKGSEPKREDFELELEQWGGIAEIIKNEGYANNVSVTRGGIGNKVIMVWYSNTTLTMKGIEFLEENSGWTKAYKGAKEFRDWLKL